MSRKENSTVSAHYDLTASRASFPVKQPVYYHSAGNQSFAKTERRRNAQEQKTAQEQNRPISKSLHASDRRDLSSAVSSIRTWGAVGNWFPADEKPATDLCSAAGYYPIYQSRQGITFTGDGDENIKLAFKKGSAGKRSSR